ncbi:MAG TPA: hypothetical protein VFH68_25070 [Polyangia bacterium]|nr:hypothetical protein [Polyangia bacterium]
MWDQAGHLTEIALHALADGELGLLPAQAVAHSAGCRQCEERLGAIALLAVELGEALVKHRPELVSVRRPLPVAAFAAALAIAVVGIMTQLGGMAAQVTRLPMLIAHASPVLARGLTLAVGGASGRAGFAAAGWVAAALLVVVGVLIARRAPLRLNLKGSA